jgi:hypothetical protein
MEKRMFRYIITNTFEGCLQGTNDEQTAKQFAVCEDFFVYDTATHEWMVGDNRHKLEEASVS